MTVAVCNIGQEMNEELKAFRFSRSTKPRALILKIDPASKGKNKYYFNFCLRNYEMHSGLKNKMEK